MSKDLVIKPINRLKAIVNSDSVKKQFKNALGKHSDLFVASLIDVFNDGLQDCDPGLVIQEALKAATLKLPIAKSLGFAYIIPYKKIPQFQIGYKGLAQLAMRSGQLKILNPDVVYDGELKGVDKLTGSIDLSGEKKSDKVIGYFVYMELINGFKKTEYWSKEKVTAHKDKYSQSYKADIKYKTKKSIWMTNEDSMGIKTVLKSVLGKYAPLSVDFVMALNFEAEHFNDTEEEADAFIMPPPLMSDKNAKEKQKISPQAAELNKILTSTKYAATLEEVYKRSDKTGITSKDAIIWVRDHATNNDIEKTIADILKIHVELSESKIASKHKDSTEVAKLREIMDSSVYADTIAKAYEMKTLDEGDIDYVLSENYSKRATIITDLILKTHEELEADRNFSERPF